MYEVKVNNSVNVPTIPGNDDSLEISLDSRMTLNSGLLLKAVQVINGPEGLNILLPNGDTLVGVPESSVSYKQIGPVNISDDDEDDDEIPKQSKRANKPPKKKKGGCGCGKRR